jgi:1-acyl-sn-glycerol-3-phosphate acyltransferase
MADDRLIQRSVTDEIMYELMRLSGQEYVDEYAAVVKLRLAGRALAGEALAGTSPGAVPAADGTADDPALPGGPDLPDDQASAGDDGPAGPGKV